MGRKFIEHECDFVLMTCRTKEMVSVADIVGTMSSTSSNPTEFLEVSPSLLGQILSNHQPIIIVTMVAVAGIQVKKARTSIYNDCLSTANPSDLINDSCLNRSILMCLSSRDMSSIGPKRTLQCLLEDICDICYQTHVQKFLFRLFIK